MLPGVTYTVLSASLQAAILPSFSCSFLPKLVHSGPWISRLVFCYSLAGPPNTPPSFLFSSRPPNTPPPLPVLYPYRPPNTSPPTASPPPISPPHSLLTASRNQVLNMPFIPISREATPLQDGHTWRCERLMYLHYMAGHKGYPRRVWPNRLVCLLDAAIRSTRNARWGL